MTIEATEALGFLVGFLTLFMGWINVRVDGIDKKKVSKDVFEQFQKSNEKEHEHQQKTLDAIWDELKGKQDKR